MKAGGRQLAGGDTSAQVPATEIREAAVGAHVRILPDQPDHSEVPRPDGGREEQSPLKARSRPAGLPDLLVRLFPFAGRTRQANAFVEQFKKIAAHAHSAAESLVMGLRGAPDAALAAITENERSADEAVREVQRLVDETFIAPYDKRDIIKLAHRLDRVVDAMQRVARLLVSYRALEAANRRAFAGLALGMCENILDCIVLLRQVVDDMPAFDHDGLRGAARSIKAMEERCDETYARAIGALFPDPNQPLTAAMLAWRDIFRLLELTTDYCSHAIGQIVSIARQEGS